MQDIPAYQKPWDLGVQHGNWQKTDSFIGSKVENPLDAEFPWSRSFGGHLRLYQTELRLGSEPSRCDLCETLQCFPASAISRLVSQILNMYPKLLQFFMARGHFSCEQAGQLQRELFLSLLFYATPPRIQTGAWQRKARPISRTDASTRLDGTDAIRLITALGNEWQN
ncbi:hypothetical protein P152DRAFT_227556 [Eremomyces bilateralis CBS 781.70]|uniref:Uncharacterized protein n=1 Tax=Eremomyces bilateralis CBS 781.70 TaxID=1392243 RepID=A0A6G1FR33_9PEZI|nr:uncharacterized protein P152DRAFT_227556 [Eremomyces bilateralis CBS 781.70]KAF1808233.1 hypothetical protein P152DRAFT_227556 [Eremomyces bilateralis CBS 781.70]